MAAAGTVDRFLGADTVFIVFITRPNMGTWTRPTLCIRLTISHAVYDDTYGKYINTRFSPSALFSPKLSPVKFECSYHDMGDEM